MLAVEMFNYAEKPLFPPTMGYWRACLSQEEGHEQCTSDQQIDIIRH
jgi:hypothetical protein